MSRLKNEEEEVEKFVMANTQELAKDKWLCPLSGMYTVPTYLCRMRPTTHCKKKVSDQPPNSPWLDKNKLFPAIESLVSDIPAGERKIVNLFYSVDAFAVKKFYIEGAH